MRRLLICLLALAACADEQQSSSTDVPDPTEVPTVSASVAIDETVRSTSPTITTDTPNTPPTSTPVPDDAVLPSGFELIAATLTKPDGTVCDLCLWLADSGAQRSRGLMGVTHLGPADGMAFRYPEPHTTQFWMKDTLLPLSIAFYGPDRVFIDSFDMEPCITEECQRYPTPTRFVVAVETYQGDLEQLEMIAGSTLELLDLPCRS